MPTISTSRLHHLRITVTDLQRSLDFYTRVFDFEVVARSSADPADPAARDDPNQLYGGAILSAHGLWFGLRPVADPVDRFRSERVGLDHLSFELASRDELERVAGLLDAIAVAHGEIQDLAAFGIAIMSVEDPDGIHLELCAAL